MNKSTTGPKKVVKTKRSLMEFLRKRTTKNYRIAVIAWIGFGENNALNPVWNVVPNINTLSIYAQFHPQNMSRN